MSRVLRSHGTWPSPITAEAVVASASTVSDVRVVGGVVVWAESRPDEGGRIALVREAAGVRTEVLPEGWSARTRVHEYGGGAWLACEDAIFVSSWDDQRLWRIDVDASGVMADPVAITPEPVIRHGDRYVDADRFGDWLVVVREHHGDEVVNEIVAIPVDGSQTPVVLVSGPDFVSDPKVSPDGTTLTWVAWDHPAMPWDETVLSTAPITFGTTPTIGTATVVAGGPLAREEMGRGESVIQPRWSPDGVLHFISDRSDWWNVEAWDGSSRRAITTENAEVGTPPWVFGMSRYGFLGDGRLVAARSSDGIDRLGLVGADGGWADLAVGATEISSVTTTGSTVVYVGADHATEPTVYALDLAHDHGTPRVVRAARDLPFDAVWCSCAQPIAFPSGPGGSRTAHANFYPPWNPEVESPAGERPPLLVLIHGGPTAMARTRLDLAKQFWTSRGFALVDVNYGGSTGFGRPYRDLLQDNWGIIDVEDCIAAARHLAEQGLVDADRRCIRGGSAGGFTVLAALTATGGQAGVFAAGASSYGVADLTALAEETHKFESRYLDGLVGPYPEAKSVYDERSPINHVDRLESPLIVFQGLEDEIVPPNQSEMIVGALRAKGVPVAYLAFEGEQHGFRRSETVIAVLCAELAFYGAVLGFEPSDDLPPIEIENL